VLVILCEDEELSFRTAGAAGLSGWFSLSHDFGQRPLTRRNDQLFAVGQIANQFLQVGLGFLHRDRRRHSGSSVRLKETCSVDQTTSVHRDRLPIHPRMSSFDLWLPYLTILSRNGHLPRHLLLGARQVDIVDAIISSSSTPLHFRGVIGYCGLDPRWPRYAQNAAYASYRSALDQVVAWHRRLRKSYWI
jgi:hypothetical protein